MIGTAFQKKQINGI